MSEHTFGRDPPIHPVTKMPLERGSGALPDHLQAYRIHVPSLPVANQPAMLAALDAFYNPPPTPPNLRPFEQEIKQTVKKAAQAAKKIAKDI